MKIKLVFDDWRKTGRSIYQTKIGIDLGMGPFHSGTTFNGEIDLDIDEAAELETSIRQGYDPIFRIMLP